MESTHVVIIGAGPAGLTVANLLHAARVPCVVLEHRSVLMLQRRSV